MSAIHPLTFKKIPSLVEIEAAYPGLKALFFDMDGTLFDTEKYHIEAMLKIGRDYQIVAPFGPTEVHELMVGRADHLVFDIVKYWENFPSEWSVTDFVNTKNQHFLEIVKNVHERDYFSPALRDLIHVSKNKNLKIALVTSSERPVVDALLKLSGLEKFFHLVLTRNDCPKHKPDPWPYLEAIRFFDLSAKEALIFEDSGVGLLAAGGSGAHAVKVEWY